MALFTNYKAGFQTDLGINFNCEFSYAHTRYPNPTNPNVTWTNNQTDFDTTLNLVRHGIDIGSYFYGLQNNQEITVLTLPSGYKICVRRGGTYDLNIIVRNADNTDYYYVIGASVLDNFFSYPAHAYVFAVEDTTTHYLSMGAIVSGRPYNNNNTYYTYNVTISSSDNIGAIIDAFYRDALNTAYVDSYDPMSTADETTDGEGGYGQFDYSSDDDTIPALPQISVTAAGFVNLFKMTDTTIADLANYLWSGLFDIDTYLKLFGDPMDCILSLGIVPLNPPASAPLYVIVGNHATTIQAPRISNQFQALDCGTISVKGNKYSNSFMDYSPYTSAQLYLPYIGTVSLDVDEIMDSTIHVVYHIDLLSGSCVAYVEVTKQYNYKNASHTHTNVLYQYSGNVLTNVPITSQNFTQVLQAVIGAVAVGVSGGATAGVAAGSGEAAGSMTADHAAEAIGATAQMKPSVSRSGNCSSACGLLGTQKPKLMLTLPKIAYAEDMNKERGYPTYMRKTISSMTGTGFTKVELAHLKSIPCTDTERDEIIRLLESGVEL